MKWDRSYIVNRMRKAYSLRGRDSEAIRLIDSYGESMSSRGIDQDRGHDIAVTNLGYATGDGIPLKERRFWKKHGIVHPVLGKEFARRDFSPKELVKAGVEAAKK